MTLKSRDWATASSRCLSVGRQHGMADGEAELELSNETAARSPLRDGRLTLGRFPRSAPQTTLREYLGNRLRFLNTGRMGHPCRIRCSINWPRTSASRGIGAPGHISASHR
jgi:hypothetical protein